MKSLIIGLMLVAVFVAHGHGLKCYNCNSLTDLNCGKDNFALSQKEGTCRGRVLDPSTMFTARVQSQMYQPSLDTCCEGDNVVCMKTTSTVRGMKIIKRTCYRASISTQCLNISLAGVKVHGCYCTTDYCNGEDNRGTTAIQTTNVTKCYMCISSLDDKCADDKFGFSPRSSTCDGTIHTGCCEGEDVTCTKKKVEVKGKSVVERGCYRAYKKEGCSEFTLGDVTGTTCHCRGNYCNTVEIAKPHFFLLLVTVMISLN